MLSPEMWYNPAFTSNMMMPTFPPGYNIQPYELGNDENHPPEPVIDRTQSSPVETYDNQQTKFQQKSDSSFEDEESRRKYRERRNKNNMAAKKSRLNRRERENRLQRMVNEYEKQISELSKRLEFCMQEIGFWRKKYGQQPFSTAVNPTTPVMPPTPPSCQNTAVTAVTGDAVTAVGASAAAATTPLPTPSDRILCPSSVNILQPQTQFLYPTMQCCANPIS